METTIKGYDVTVLEHSQVRDGLAVYTNNDIVNSQAYQIIIQIYYSNTIM